MTKKVINQKGKFDYELINTIEPNFIYKLKLLRYVIILIMRLGLNKDKEI